MANELAELVERLRVLAAGMRSMADEWAAREIGDKYDAVAASTYRNDATLLEQAATALLASEALIRRAGEVIAPFVAVLDREDAHYRKRGGDPDLFTDNHPFIDLNADRLALGKWRALRTLAADIALRGGKK